MRKRDCERARERERVRERETDRQTLIRWLQFNTLGSSEVSILHLNPERQMELSVKRASD